MTKIKELHKSSKFPNPNCQTTLFRLLIVLKPTIDVSALFQGKVKYLNLINHNFLKVFDSIQV